MRILVISYEFPPIGGGGGRAAYDICRYLAAHGYEITVLTAWMNGLPRDEIQDGVRLVRIPSMRAEAFRAPFSTMLSFVLAGLWAGLHLIITSRPDIIHVHFAVPSGAIAWMLSMLTGIPYVLTAHLGDVPGGVPEKTDRWFRWLLPFTYPIWRRAKKIIAVSEYTRQLALKHYPVDIDVIANGADVQHLMPLGIRINEPPRLVFAGRFVPQKNPIAIVKILSQLKDLEWHCAMLGDGPLSVQVKLEIEKAGLEKHFELPGWVTPDDVLDWFSKSDILFMPSLSEGLPIVGVQALAKGLVLVVSKIGGFMDLVDDGANGFLIDLNDYDSFVRVLRDLLTNRSSLMTCREKSLEKAMVFDLTRVANQYQTTFREALNGE